MVALKALFDYKTGNLPALELTENGNVPLVYGTTKNNGVIKMVKIYNDSIIFKAPLITVSYLGTAFVQTNDFTTSVVDKSNITVLVPKKEMTLEELYYYCFQINRIACFGFNYGRRMNQKQLNKIQLSNFTKTVKKELKINIDLKSYLPKKVEKTDVESIIANFKAFPLSKFFNIKKGIGLYKYQYEQGKMPLVSATSFNNGILEYVDSESSFSPKTITVERIKGNTFVQLKPYTTIPDDISVLVPINKKMTIAELFYFAYIIRQEAWRFSYGRKLSPTRLKTFELMLPVDNKNQPDFNTINQLVKNIYGWNEVINSHPTASAIL